MHSRLNRSVTDLETAIAERRAVRRFTTEVVDRETIEGLLGAAVMAPSAMNLQPWAFAVFQGAELLEDFSSLARRHLETVAPHELHPEARLHLATRSTNLFHGATTLIVVCATSPERQAAEDCCLVAQNLMLLAHVRGLATCPIGFARSWLDLPETREALELGDAIPIFPLVLGYPAERPPRTSRREPLLVAWR
jgi:nitroreductase